MTTKQLADRMGIAQPNIMAIEDREVKQTISLETLEKAARAMDCKLIYAIVPNEDWSPKSETSSNIIYSTTLPILEDNDELSLLQKSLRNLR